MAQASQQDASTKLTPVLLDMNAFLARTAQPIVIILQRLQEVRSRGTRAAHLLREVCVAVSHHITLRAATLKAAATTSHHRVAKLLSEKIEEAITNQRLLQVVAFICQRAHFTSSTSCVRLASQLAGPQFMLLDTIRALNDIETRGSMFSYLLLCEASALLPVVCGLSAVWRDAIDPALCGLAGGGAQRFCTTCENEIAVTFRTTSGALAEYVVADDIIVTVCDPSCDDDLCGDAAAPACSEGAWKICYTVHKISAEAVTLRIFACGYLAFQHRVPLARIGGTRKHCLELHQEATNTFGMAISHDGSHLIVSHSNQHMLASYVISPSCDSAAFLSWYGQYGDGPLQFNCPYKMCIGPSDTILVCEIGNERIQELTGVTSNILVHRRFIPVPDARTVALHDGLLAVGTGAATIQLLSYDTCVVLRSIGSHGSGPGDIGDVCEGMCFTADGCFLLVAEQSNHRVSMFSVAEGSFHCHVGAGLLSDLHKDVKIAHNHEIVIADYSNHRICVFSPTGDTLLRSFSTRVALDAGGTACFPTALAVTHDKLFVLFELDLNVLVFE